ncbi:MAG: guanylate kinase [Steroidobacteraceae bacterium]
MNSRQGRLFVVSAPSGAGKTSLVRALLRQRVDLRVSVSHTTRAPRPQEVNGRDYCFVSQQEFQELVAAGAFLEHAEVFGNFYGTGRAQVEAALAKGLDLLLEIDWQGARQVRRSLPACVTIFILPPSRETLEQRLHSRGTDSAEVIARRLGEAREDLEHWSEFDYVVVNDRFEDALQQIERILDGEGGSLRADRPGLKPLLAALLA